MSNQKKILGFIALAIAMFMGTLDSTITNIALPDIMEYFKSNLNDTSWISTIYVLGLSVFMITASKLADQFGRKKVMIIGLILFGTSSAFCGLSKSLLFLITMRFVQGIGGAIITPIVVPMALEIFGKDNTQKVAGAVGASTALAAAGGPPLGGLFIKYISWQMIFFVNVPCAFISLVLTIFFIKESYDRTVSKSIDWLGMLFLTATLFPLTFGLLKGRDYGWDSMLIISMFVCCVISFVLFIITESRIKAPLVELGLFQERTFTASSICYMITGFGIVSPILVFNYFMQNVLGYDVLKAAFIVMAVSLSVIVTMPLGSVIAGKFGARPINFIGIICMGIGVFLLSLLDVNSPVSTMIADMIVCGIGLGFSCQAMVSSIKYLPADKSGIGSGVVNCARQIGTCIGIALLVNILNINVTDAKDNILDYAVKTVNDTGIDNSVQTVIVHDIRDSVNSDNTNKKALEKKLKKDVKAALADLSDTSKPENNTTLLKLYNGCYSLGDGLSKVTDGEASLNTGLISLSSGLDTIYNGSTKLTSGLTSFHNGLTKLQEGTQTLNEKGSDGVSRLTSGIGKLNDGAQQILIQFSSGKSSGKITLYDGVNGIATGAATLSSSLDGYTTAVNNTIYLMITSNPYASQLLSGYKIKLIQAQTAYASAGKAEKDQYLLQIKALKNLVTLYTASTDKSVTNIDQFQDKLMSLAKQDKTNQTVVSYGSKLVEGSNKLENATKNAAHQFRKDGTLKNGMQQLAGGISKLNNKSKDLSGITIGLSNINNAVLKLESGSNDLFEGSKKLQKGIKTADKGSNKLLKGSQKLIAANEKISKGVDKVTSGIGIAGQAVQTQEALNDIESYKDDNITEAFSKTFLLAAIVLMIVSFMGFLTDRRTKAD